MFLHNIPEGNLQGKSFKDRVRSCSCCTLHHACRSTLLPIVDLVMLAASSCGLCMVGVDRIRSRLLCPGVVAAVSTY